MSLGEQVKLHRLNRKMSLSELALQAGTTKSHIWNIERGKSDPSASKLKAIAFALRVTPNELLEDGDYSQLKEYWVQGECVKYKTYDAALAARDYQHDMAAGGIAIKTRVADE